MQRWGLGAAIDRSIGLCEARHVHSIDHKTQSNTHAQTGLIPFVLPESFQGIRPVSVTFGEKQNIFDKYAPLPHPLPP